MREITVFTSTGQSGPINVESEPDRQIRKVLRTAEIAFHTNGLWPPEPDQIWKERYWVFGLEEMVRLQYELDRLRSLMQKITDSPTTG